MCICVNARLCINYPPPPPPLTHTHNKKSVFAYVFTIGFISTALAYLFPNLIYVNYQKAIELQKPASPGKLHRRPYWIYMGAKIIEQYQFLI